MLPYSTSPTSKRSAGFRFWHLGELALSDITETMLRDPLACLESWSDELLSRASRVRNLIGDAHWLSDGHHKEELVRAYLVRHLPKAYRISRGFICSTDAKTRVSPEIDVLITDEAAELPWL